MRHPHRRRKHANKTTFYGGMTVPRRGMLFAQRAAVLQVIRETNVMPAAVAPTKSARDETARETVQNH